MCHSFCIKTVPDALVATCQKDCSDTAVAESKRAKKTVTDALVVESQHVVLQIIRRKEERFRSVRTKDSRSSMSWRALVLATPMKLQKSRMELAGYPRRLRARRVGSRGSSQPSTTPAVTSSFSCRFEVTVCVSSRRANSVW